MMLTYLENSSLRIHLSIPAKGKCSLDFCDDAGQFLELWL